MNHTIPRPHKRVIFDGNSLSTKDGTGGNGFYRFPITCCNTLKTNGKIFAQHYYPLSGRQTITLVNEFPSKIAPNVLPNDIVVIWEITNDLRINSATAQQAYDNIVTYCGLVKALKAKVVVLGFIARDYAGDAADINDRGFACNALIESNWTSFADGWVNLGTNVNFDSKADASNTTYYLSDKIHLTDAGYDLVASLAEPTIRALI